MPQTVILDEKTTGRYESLEIAQKAGLQAVAAAIARAVRANLKSGRYVIEDGVVKLADGHTIEPDQGAE